MHSDDAADATDDGDDGGPVDAADTPSRYDRLERHPTPGPGNSLSRWTEARAPLTVVRNYLLVWLVRVSPSLRLKRWALRRLGATVASGVSWGLEATPDVFWPERITLGEDVVVGYDSVILCHEFLQDEYRVGDVVLGDRAMIGAKATVLPGVRIGADAQVAANSLVADDVPPGETVAGVPAEPVEREREEETDGTADTDRTDDIDGTDGTEERDRTDDTERPDDTDRTATADED